MTTIIKLSNWVGVSLFFIYLIAMVLTPFFSGDWQYVQNVWDRWQGFNVGVLALLSSWAVLYITTYRDKVRDDREFKAAIAKLPSALSDLCEYLKQSADFYKKAWEAIETKNNFNEVLPLQPEHYKQEISECIVYAPPEVADWMRSILGEMQVHNARIRDLKNELNASNRSFIDSYNLLGYIYRLATVRAMIERLFPYTRDGRPYNLSSLKLSDLEVAYSAIGVNADNLTARSHDGQTEISLQRFTVNRLEAQEPSV